MGLARFSLAKVVIDAFIEGRWIAQALSRAWHRQSCLLGVFSVREDRSVLQLLLVFTISALTAAFLH